MCGRFAQLQDPREIFRRCAPASQRPCFHPQGNVCPSQDLWVIGQGGRVGQMRWGLIPSWVKDPKSARKLINARSETLDEKPSFRGLLAHKRCLVPADGFYEWKQLEGKAKKQLYRFQRRDARPFCFAGLWDLWQGMGGKAVYTFTVITTTANGLVDQVHARMPALLDEATQLRWIASGALSPMERRTLLQPYPAERLQMMALPELPHDRPEG